MLRVRTGTLSRMSQPESHEAISLPSLDRIAAALHDITEVLAAELTKPSEQPPEWNEFDWRIARAAASMQGIAPALRDGLRWSETHGWREFIDGQYAHVAARHARMSALLKTIGGAATEAGVAIVALKGAALHELGIYQPGERPMADLDFLVSESDLAATTLLLERCGFKQTFATWRHQLFEMPGEGGANADLGEHRDRPLKIELHTSIRERLPISEIEITGFVLPKDPRPGLNRYRSLAGLMLHLLLHAAGNMRAHALRMIQLHDIARLAQRMSVDDWYELVTAGPGGVPPWWASPPLLLTARYYPGVVPPLTIERVVAMCPRWLARISRKQQISRVSWSNIKVYAFPGIEWSQNPVEALIFVASRIWPNRAARVELREFSARDPNAAKIPWYGISHGARILRWIFSRPPRVQTLLAVQAALAQRC
jgi:hypothetical protein